MIVKDRMANCIIFSQEIVEDHSGGSADELATVYSIVNSLTVNFPEFRNRNIWRRGNGFSMIEISIVRIILGVPGARAELQPLRPRTRKLDAAVELATRFEPEA